MKKLHIPLLCLLSLSSFAQDIGNRKVDIGVAPTITTATSNPDFYTRLRLEGKGVFDKQLTYPSSFTAWPATPTSVSASGGSDAGYMGQIQKFPGKAWWVESIDVWASKAITLNMVFQNGRTSAIRAFKYQSPIPAGKSSIIVRQWLAGDEGIAFTSVNGIDNSDKLVFTATPVTVEMTDCLDFTAKKLILYIGDSITESTNMGTLGTITSEQTWPRKVWKRYVDRGEDVRYVNMGQAGQTATQAELARLDGTYSALIKAANLTFYMEGINDVGGNSTATQVMQDAYTANVTNMINYFLQQNKVGGKLVMMGPTPVEGTTKHNVAEVYRSILQSVVATYATSNPGRIIYVNMAGAFNRTDRAYYYSAEPANNAVHPGIVGAQAMYDYLNSQVLTPSINTLP